MANKTAKAVGDFLRRYKIKKITAESLESAMERQGYTVIEFDREDNSDDVNTLIREFGLSGYISNSKGFTYADKNYRLVFVNSELSDYERLIVLAHEEGHIFCGHFGEAPVIGRDVIQEYEANEFAHYILNPRLTVRIGQHRTAVVVSFIFIAVIVISCISASRTFEENIYYKDYYITETGFKYHRADCGYVKGKDNLRRLTKEEFESGKYEPCGMCLPE